MEKTRQLKGPATGSHLATLWQQDCCLSWAQHTEVFKQNYVRCLDHTSLV